MPQDQTVISNIAMCFHWFLLRQFAKSGWAASMYLANLCNNYATFEKYCTKTLQGFAMMSTHGTLCMRPSCLIQSWDAQGPWHTCGWGYKNVNTVAAQASHD